MDYITIATTGNATDFGDLTGTNYGQGPASSGTRGVFAGGFRSGSYLRSIDYRTIATTGNASNFGNLIGLKYTSGGLSGD